METTICLEGRPCFQHRLGCRVLGFKGLGFLDFRV